MDVGPADGAGVLGAADGILDGWTEGVPVGVNVGTMDRLGCGQPVGPAVVGT